MKDNKTSKLTFIVVLAAVVAALTTVAVLVLRAKAKKQALCRYNDRFDYDLDDCGCDDDCCCVEEPAAEEPAGDTKED